MHFAVDARGFAGGDAEGVDQAGDFAARILDRLAGLDAQRLRQFLEALAEAAHAMFEHIAARIGREGRHRLARLVRGHDRLAHGRGIGERNARRALAAVLVEHVQFLFALTGWLAR